MILNLPRYFGGEFHQNICAETLAGNEPKKNGPDDLKIRPLDTIDTSPHSKQPWNGGAKSTFWTNSEAVETAKQLIVGRCSKVYAQKGIDMVYADCDMYSGWWFGT
jgi:hypothetical protein